MDGFFNDFFLFESSSRATNMDGFNIFLEGLAYLNFCKMLLEWNIFKGIFLRSIIRHIYEDFLCYCLKGQPKIQPFIFKEIFETTVWAKGVDFLRNFCKDDQDIKHGLFTFFPKDYHYFKRGVLKEIFARAIITLNANFFLFFFLNY